MKNWMPIRLSLLFAMLMMMATTVASQVPAPFGGSQSFWNNPQTAKTLKLTPQQQAELNNLVNDANKQFLLDVRGKFSPEQWKQIQSLRTNHSGIASQLGLEGPDAQQVANILKVNRTAAQNYVILMNEKLSQAVVSSVMRLAASRGQTADPCKTASEAAIYAAPNLDSTQLKFTITLESKTFTGSSCPDAMADLKFQRPVKLTATYPCAVTTEGVDLAPDCKISSSVTTYVY
ncbi:MAG: hypothetical protein WBQ94_14370 [Terracidiphilus sp.]